MSDSEVSVGSYPSRNDFSDDEMRDYLNTLAESSSDESLNAYEQDVGEPMTTDSEDEPVENTLKQDVHTEPKKEEMVRVNPITDEDFEQVEGKVFVDCGCYSIKAVRVFRKTKCFVFGHYVEIKNTYDRSTGNGTHKIDWKWIDENPIKDKKRGGDQFQLHRVGSEYHLTKGSGSLLEFYGMANRETDRAYSTVEY